ncbi:MAG TPA: alpha/beta hydrolase [Pararobbsia sp.]|nr:alpha/beta hydrolase [Pararobbsia sp.]
MDWATRASRGPALLAPAEYSRVIETNDGRVHFLDIGTGPPLVLLQGWGPLPGVTGWWIYREVLASLSQRYRCIVYDLPNFGLSGPVVYNEPVHDVAARQVIAVMDHLGIERAALVGTSMGATTAIDVALAHPQRVSLLVAGACHASTGGDPYLLGPFPSEVTRLFLELKNDRHDRSKLVRLLEGLVFDPALVGDALVDEMTAFRAERDDHHAADFASTSVPHSNMTALAQLRMPMLVIHGRFDRMVPFEQALMLMSYVPHADVVVFNVCGHWPPFERPGEFVSHVQRFLDRHNDAG